ncbi:MAG TPA: AraC family transcriptional regulator [Xanthobacteraceae bacterium]|nr:AraC family transcriptional regulator [Xanthobacteraceae bacterium]
MDVPKGNSRIVSRIDRFASDDVPERERVAFVREVYGQVVKHDIEPRPGSAFYWRSTLCILPGLALAATDCSAVHTRRTAAQIDSDALIINVTVAGRRIVRQRGREAICAPGEAALTRSREIASCDCVPGSKLLNLRIPLEALGSRLGDLDPLLARTIPADTGALVLLIRYAEMMQRQEMTAAFASAQASGLAVAHVYDLVALMLGRPLAADGPEPPVGTAAARLAAIKSDILRCAHEQDLSAATIAARHGVSARYVRKLFEREHQTFSAFVLAQRLERVHRMLTSLDHAGRPISDIAFACGFGDLSYFNRAFRRQFGATPSLVRAAARHGGE